METTTVEVRRYSGEVERHQHDYHQVILPCSGVLEIEIERHSGRVAGSVASFVPAGRSHTFLAKREHAFIVLDIPSGHGTDGIDDEAIPPFFTVGPEVQGLIDYMAVVGSQAELSPLLRAAWSALILDRLAKQRGKADRVETAMRRAIAFMKLRLADSIRVGDIAEAAGISSTRLHGAFAKRYATTPHAQLVALRLDAAERMLADPHLSIAEIAIRSGHSDQSALTRAMQRERGTTPAEVRRRLLARLGGNA